MSRISASELVVEKRGGKHVKKKKHIYLLGDILACAGMAVVYVIPFLFILFNALKDRKEANKLNFTLPEVFHFENFLEVIQARNYQLLTAFKNSALITFFSVVLLLVVGAMAGYIIQRRRDRAVRFISNVFMLGLMLPPAILPTIWVLQTLHIYKTFFSIVMIETVLNLPFTIMLYRGYISTIPRELEEAGYIDGCSRWKIFSQIVFPLLKPIHATVVILNAIYIFNDFTNPLYFYPGAENATVVLTLYNFIGQFQSSYNLLFADVVIIIIPMLILFIIFNKKIVNGMVAGAVKG